MLVYALFLAWAVNRGRLPPELAVGVVVVSLITWIAYAVDKRAAQAGRWRIAESTLHWLELLGGWPGAIAAQQWMRHKTQKAGFRAVFWLMVLLHVAALVAWVYWRSQRA